MKCIDQQQLQQYIDGECTANKKAAIEKHLSECTRCYKKLYEMKALAVNAQHAIASLNRNNIEVPTFNYAKLKTKTKKIKYIIYSLSAACIIFFIFIFVDKKQEPCAEPVSIVQTLTWEADANQTFANQDFAIQITDCRGKSKVIYLE
ncbi:MAG: zf-HC2 domain-containing protein [Prolixibacteraceae bacterium]|jgi:predicted anti-sigma-YlaC factor YlaD|nr:zf-HC2 domain-containing protein [Prolixibacteraceae bacterium]